MVDDPYKVTHISGVGYPTTTTTYTSRQAFIEWFKFADIDDNDIIVINAVPK